MVWPFDDDDSTRSSRSDATAPPPNQRQPTSHDDEANPFIAFRRFADDQVRLLATGLSAVPTFLSALEERGTSSPLTSWPTVAAHQGQHGHFVPPITPEAVAHTRALLLQSRSALAAAGVAPGRIISLFRDGESAVHWPFDLISATGEPIWLSPDWFMRSRYSPALCEVDPHLHQQGSMWRAAFEDLMCASLGTEQRAREAWTGRRDDQRLYAAWAEGARDWMLGLMCRGVVPPLLPALYQLPDRRLMDQVWKDFIHAHDGEHGIDVRYVPARRDFWALVKEVGWFDGDEREEQLKAVRREAEIVPKTELDAYEQFLGRANGTQEEEEAKMQSQLKPKVEHTRNAAEPTRRSAAKQEATQSKILSTLSTTEKTTLPDGTITTKVVLKRRFANGSEHMTETVSTMHPDGDQEMWKGFDGKSAETHKEIKPEQKQKSWFWG